MEPVYILGSFLVAYIAFKVLTRPRPQDNTLRKTYSAILNNEEFRVKGKFEE